MLNGQTNNTAELYAQVELQAAKAKENYDGWVQQKAADAASKPTGLDWRLPNKNATDAPVMEGPERYTRYQLRKNYWRFELTTKATAADLSSFLQLAELPEFVSDVKQHHEIQLDGFGTKLREALLKKELRGCVVEAELGGKELKVTQVDYVNCDDVCNCVSPNTTITKLILSDNKIDPDCIEGIVNVITNNTTLTYLDVSENDLQNEGVNKLMTAMSNNTTLIHLDISMVNFGLSGCRGISTFITENRPLLKLLMNGNDKVGGRGCEVIAEALEKNSSLTVLGLSNTSLGTDSVDLLQNIMVEKKNSTLCEIQLAGNKFKESSYTKLFEILEDNMDAYFGKQKEIYIEKQKTFEQDEKLRLEAEKKRKAEAEEEEKQRKKQEEEDAKNQVEAEKKVQEETEKAKQDEHQSQSQSQSDGGTTSQHIPPLANQKEDAESGCNTTQASAATDTKGTTELPTSTQPTDTQTKKPQISSSSTSLPPTSGSSPTATTKRKTGTTGGGNLPKIGAKRKPASLSSSSVRPSSSTGSKVTSPPKLSSTTSSSPKANERGNQAQPKAKLKPIAKRSAKPK